MARTLRENMKMKVTTKGFSSVWIKTLWISTMLGFTCAQIPTICQPGQTSRCYRIDTRPMSWYQADTECTSQGGILAKVISTFENTILANFAQMNSVFTLWTGGMVTDDNWILDGVSRSKSRHITYLGCYGQSGAVSGPEIAHALPSGPSTDAPSKCAKSCEATDGAFKYYSVFRDNNNQVVCRCGKTYSTYVKRQDVRCDTMCPNMPPKNSFDDRERENLDKYCGTAEFQIINRIYGLQFHDWVPPSQQGFHHCVALDYASDWKWKDYHCNDRRLSHLCEYDVSSSSNCPNPKIWLSKGKDGICISQHTDSLNWFQAKNHCESQGGYLLEIRDHATQKELEKKVLSGTGERFWIAHIRQSWTWKDGSPIQIYYGWEVGNPESLASNIPQCLVMKQPNYKWFSDSCNNQHPFVCEFPNGIAHLAGLNTAPDPNQKGQQDNQSGSTDQTLIIGAAAGGGVILVLVVVFVIVLCYCKRKGKTTKKPMTRLPPKVPLSGNENHAISTDETGGRDKKTKDNTYIGDRRTPPPVPEESYLALQDPYTVKGTPNVYEALDPKPGDDVYQDYVDMTESPKQIGGYVDMTGGSPKLPVYDNAYEHYLKPVKG